jgi:hypothetical protein
MAGAEFKMKRFPIGGWCGAGTRRIVRLARVLVPAFAIVQLAAVATASLARADCTPAADNNVTATCTGTTSNQAGGAPGTTAGFNGFGTGLETGVTVSVAGGAGVTGSHAGIFLVDATVTNNAGAAITGAFGIAASTGAANVTNTGSITGTTDTGIAASDATVTNNAGAAITGGFFGINAFTGAANVTNSGNITGSTDTGIFAQTNAIVTNNPGAAITGGVSGNVANFGAANVTNSGSIAGTTFAGIFAQTNATVINNAAAAITGLTGILARGSAIVTNSGSITGTSGQGISADADAAVTNNAGATITGGGFGIFAASSGSSVFNAGSISGGIAAIQFAGSGNTLTLAPGSVISGIVQGTGADIFQLGGSGAASFDIAAIGAAGQYRGFGTFNKISVSTWRLTGTSSFAGPVNVNGGTLSVNGDISSASGVTVNAGGMLGGNGIVGNTVINGGTLAPGNSIGLLTVQGNLAFTAAASYMVEVSPSNADRTNVTGVATLGGATVNASFAAGTYVAKQYTILNATGGVSGTFGAEVNSNLPANFHTSLSYDADNAYLNLLLNFAVPTGLNGNQQKVGNALTHFFNATGGIPIVFGALTPAALTQASGETATGLQQTTFDAMNLFMGVLTDPFIARRGDGVSSSSGAPQFADENDNANAFADNGKPRSKSVRSARLCRTGSVRCEYICAG